MKNKGINFKSRVSKMYLALLLLTTAAAQLEESTTIKIDENLLVDIFGKPRNFKANQTPELTPDQQTFTTVSPFNQQHHGSGIGNEHFGIKPQLTHPKAVLTTAQPFSFMDPSVTDCICVPSYLCDDQNVLIKNCSVIGCDKLDNRFGNECQGIQERCCTERRSPSVVSPSLVSPGPVFDTPMGCGYRNSAGVDSNMKRVEDNEALFGEFPWVVALLNVVNDSYTGVGVLIHEQVVLTAAHVVFFYDPGELVIRAGEWDMSSTKEPLIHQSRIVENILVHRDFDFEHLRNNIALLKLNNPVALDEHINVICLPSQKEKFDFSKDCIANGWGKDQFGRYAVVLKKIEQDIVRKRDCEKMLKNTILGKNFRVHNTFICSGGEEGEDTCEGDGGAPLVCPIDEDRYKLTGLAATGLGCGQQNVPSLNVAVAKFRNWIDGKMNAWGYDTSVYSIE